MVSHIETTFACMKIYKRYYNRNWTMYILYLSYTKIFVIIHFYNRNNLKTLTPLAGYTDYDRKGMYLLVDC